MSVEAKKGLVPELRFPEFRKSEGWALNRLCEIGNILQGYGFPEKLQGKVTGKYPFYKVSDISNSLKNGHNYIEIAVNHLDEQEVKSLKAKPIPTGTTIFAKIGEAIRSNRRVITTRESLFDNNVAGVKAKDGISNDQFIFYTLEQISLIEFAGGAVPSVNKTTLENILVVAPKNIAEQQKIASCLSSLDELIAANTQKLEALKANKKGLMQQLFPAEGETVPRLRFPEFEGDGEWEDKKLGDIGEPLMCKRIFKEQTTANSKNSIPFYKIGTFGKEPDSYISIALFEEFKRKYSFPKVGDILISAAGTIGRLVVYDGVPGYFQDSNIVWLGNDEQLVLNSFLFHFYSKVKWQTSDGGIISRLYNSDLKNMKVQFPIKTVEQQKIASCLSSLDSLITAQSEKIEALKTHKKGLMQGLFPSEL